MYNKNRIGSYFSLNNKLHIIIQNTYEFRKVIRRALIEEANLKIVHSIKNSINDTVRGTFILWIFAIYFYFL